MHAGVGWGQGHDKGLWGQECVCVCVGGRVGQEGRVGGRDGACAPLFAPEQQTLALLPDDSPFGFMVC